MRKARLLLILGVWVAILPYLGFPHSWKTVLFTLSGLGLIYFSYVMYQDWKKENGDSPNFDNFRENSDFENENGKVRVPVRSEYLEETNNE